ncbi:glycosyltransferase family 2 protein [Stieleria sp.]|uniref:glycosyltransferase family 2 protein n=1 Tax=Stieleria sp. TaxID=2795976 RepID=UPI003562B091
MSIPANRYRLPGASASDDAYRSIRAFNEDQNAARISFVIPVMNEEATLEELVNGIFQNVDEPEDVEVIFVDDGSTDDSWAVIQALADIHPNHVRGLRFRSNRGKAAALQAGFDVAEGEIIFTMDADLQDDPREIPRFIEKLNQGDDLVSGWKAVRHDPWHKVLPSRIFNRMLSRFSLVKLHDHNCGFKAYRRDVAKSIRLFGELHRMVPSLAGMQGFNVSEIVVEHHARKFGVSKYGIERFLRGFSDMLTIGFLRVYRERPSHFANAFAVAYAAVALIVALSGLICGPFSTNGIICLLAAACLVAMGGACVLAGLLSELMIRQHRRQPSSEHRIVADTQSHAQRHSDAGPRRTQTVSALSIAEHESLAV